MYENSKRSSQGFHTKILKFKRISIIGYGICENNFISISCERNDVLKIENELS